jgi:hypothetical protein
VNIEIFFGLKHTFHKAGSCLPWDERPNKNINC